MKLKKLHLLIAVIFLLAFFLRFFKISENLMFNAEQGQNYLAIKTAIVSRQLPLLGPPAAHLFSQGPLYYWLMMPLMMIANFNPATGTYLGIVAGSIMVLLNYWVIKEVFNKKVALFSSLLIVVSPIWIYFSREARFYFLAIIPFYLLFWFLYEFWQGKDKFLFWAGLSHGVMLNFHLGSIALIPAILLILWAKRKNLKRKSLFLGGIGFLLPNLPFLIYDLTHGLAISTKLLIWIPYRVIGFLGLYPKNNLTPLVLGENLQAFFRFFSENFVMGQESLGILVTVILIGFLVFNYKKALIFRKRKDFGWFFLLWALFLFSLAVFIHGSPPRHYFISILPLPIMVFSLFWERLGKNYLGMALVIFFLLLSAGFNLRFFFDSPAFYALRGDSPIFLKFQEKMMKVIIENAKGEKFNLKRVGEFDYYPGEYAQNYRYLAWWLGNEPTEEPTNLRYTIYEELNRLPIESEKKGEIFKVGGIVILKEAK